MEQVSKRLMNWASILEDNTREQALTTSTMPFIYPHVALMPDAHLGRGATVGSVIPTLGAIIPAAVGVDIGCVDADTEYLSPVGWRRIGDYTGGQVMQYEPDTGTGRFVTPQAFIVKDCPEFLRLHTKYGVDQMLSPDHRVLVWRIVGRDRRREPVVMTADQFEAQHERLVQGFKAEFETTFAPALDTKLPHSDDELRVQVMVHADGCIRGGKAEVHLAKRRKIERAREVLAAAGIPWTERADVGTTTVRFVPPYLTKSYGTNWWRASAEQLAIVADEVIHWDGNAEAQCYFTRDRASADFIHYVFTATGRRGVLRADLDEDGSIDYRVFAQSNTRVSMAGVPKTPITRESSVDGKAYCFTLPSGFWVMRRGGNVAMTGNCGMMAVRTQFTREDVLGGSPVLPRLNTASLQDLHHSIASRIPLSAGKYNTPTKGKVYGAYATNRTVERLNELSAMPGRAQADAVSPNWPLQLGSLGSGNHFIEVSLDEEDRVWLFLHSGSRGVGNKLATKWIKVAQDLCEKRWITLPDRDLAYLVEGDDEFEGYMFALRWAQRFAFLNREEMMDRVVAAFEEWVGDRVEQTQVVNCHHNYTERERHFGKDVWLSRKGAISAKEGEPGLIPGSMGDASYVVSGLGNRLALNSSPHGAGRNHSRSAAKRLFTREDLNKRMQGIAWGESDAFLDEHPDAYKDIDVVMQDAGDLVEVRHTLHQIVNVKGD